MQQLYVYIPSYFGSGEKRKERIRIHNQQLNWLLQSPRVKHIFVCSQDYHFGEKKKHEKISYIDHPQISPASARNVLLEHFYQSENPLAVFLDNDIFSEDYSFDFFCRFADAVKEHTDYNVLMFAGQKESPSTKIACRVSPTTSFITQFFFITKNTEQYFDEALKDMEDYEFGIRLRCNGGQLYSAEDHGFYHHTYENSVIYESWSERQTKYSGVRNEIHERYAKILGLPLYHWLALQEHKNITIQLNRL
jgi:hypothetical protein